ncbi:dienelactone hydrolase [Nannizzia gypsea CBS 118893]|uniref:Dienelactone hydrolase n=1 Tax=Arthroderma gypseum (strain ATCC MYA-4604 / CBS 118893) TaxID=535722 RepID=E4UZL4_ARTGP|nr:dienelactone hydrolase [Nannizzia gypsea CBS 118893]EFR03544.1 dienelactone hydrolase [Nannizzia gypsea CBS 118893]
MASNPPAECCIRGFIHEGTATGEIRKMGDLDIYFACPKECNKKAGKAIVILSDVMGIRINSQLLADYMASQGYLTVIPDLFHGDCLTPDAFKPGSGFDLHAWLAKHNTSVVDPVIESTVKLLRDEHGIEKIGGVGYCFGGKYVCRFLNGGKMNVGFTAHPSFISKEELSAIEGPLSIAAAEIDDILTTELRHESEEILAKGGKPYQITLYGGVSHGFAVRGDLSKPDIMFAKEQALAQALAWFGQYL